MDFTSLVPDDLLKEVFLRLPDGRSVLLSAAVCKRWCSLISSRFIEECRLYDQDRDRDRDFSILFKFSRFQRKPFYQLSSNGCRPLDLSFMPSSPRLVTRASFGDLLLLSEGNFQFFICNFLTKLWFPLPEIPLRPEFGAFLHYAITPSSGFALVRRRRDAQKLGRYRVVMITDTIFIARGFNCKLTVFDSKVGKWWWPIVFLPYPSPSSTGSPCINLDLLNPGDGVLYWLDGEYQNYAGLFALHAFSMKIRMIPLPQGEFQGLRRFKAKERVRGGVVQGRVRLSKTTMEEEEGNGNRFGLKVWELDCRSDTWSLVHDVSIVPRVPTELCFVVGFHPNDRDSIFMAFGGQGIFRYQIAEDKYAKICNFPKCVTSSEEEVSEEEIKKRVGRYLKVSTLVKPFWPTAVPASATQT